MIRTFGAQARRPRPRHLLLPPPAALQNLPSGCSSKPCETSIRTTTRCPWQGPANRRSQCSPAEMRACAPPKGGGHRIAPPMPEGGEIASWMEATAASRRCPTGRADTAACHSAARAGRTLQQRSRHYAWGGQEAEASTCRTPRGSSARRCAAPVRRRPRREAHLWRPLARPS